MTDFQPYLLYFSVEVLSTFMHGYTLRNLLETLPSRFTLV